jgi:hypothetical protein
MKMTDMKTKAEKLVDVFYSTFADERVDFIIQDLNNNAIANVLREVINQLQQSSATHPAFISCPDLLELCEELEKL